MKSKIRWILSREVAIEYKACLYFSCMLAFYCAYLLLQGIYLASIPYLIEMILCAYLIGYLQVYAMGNFDESEQIRKKEAVWALICTAVYMAMAYLLGWFGRNWVVTGIFGGYMLFCYFCVFLCNKVKRNIDTENLNRMLAEYKEKRDDD